MRFGNEVVHALQMIRDAKQTGANDVSQEAVQAGQELVRSTEGLWNDVLKKIVKIIRNELPLESPYIAVWWYSVLIGMDKNEAIFLEFVHYVRKNRETFPINTQYFLFYQLVSIHFRFKEMDGESKEVLWMFYRDIINTYAQYMAPELLTEIPLQQRKKGAVVVITEQLLRVEHGPTKTALDRCKALITKMEKEVLLINDAEALSQEGRIPFYGRMKGFYLPEEKDETQQHWKGVDVPYYQCENNMPNFQEVEHLLRKIRTISPERIIAIGKGGILANLAGRMVPMLTIGLCPSELEYTSAKYQTLGRKISGQDVELLKRLGYTKEHVIESIFTSSLKPQTEHISRAQLGIPKEKFLLAVVGARLEYEVTDEFLSMLESLLEPGMYVGFIGHFSSYEEMVKGYSKLQAHSAYLGFCEDILSRMELCDLYVNPMRKGGGTSCVEAMFKGVPVVSINYGDVAVNAGEEFCVKDYDEMHETILRYHNDKEFYDRKSVRARERADILLDTDKEFVRVIREMDRRETAQEG